MALFIVLAILVLISALVIGFFSSMTTEVKSSQSYASGVSSKQLADSAVQLVVAQIIDATKGKDSSGQLAWASQPGMIRTYDQSGNPAKYYKLYSSSALISDGAGFSMAAEAPPSDWSSRLGLFTDLNSPISRDGKIMFPILDGNFIKSLTLNESGKSVPAYLSYDANDDGKPDVEGFSIDPASLTYSASQPLSPTNNPVPMPVKWLYILQNGKLATPTASAGSTVTFDASNAPSASNPIVGRVAFWTDDETSKVNINTASEGTFWDRPFANTVTEQQASSSIPGQNEFQRYPGHPAKTSLSTIFGSKLPSPVQSPAWYYGISSGQMSQNQSELKAYYDLVPRIADGGTKGGMISNSLISGTTAAPNPNFSSIKPDTDRLYASIDELFYNPARTNNATALDAPTLERSKFFITARSRAPEINLFGKPRMTLWPIQKNTGLRNSKDDLIAFCSTIGGQPYYFQRYNAYTSSASGASSQSATLDWTGVPRNQELYSYLDDLTSKSIPGFGGSFQSKYQGTRRQILTEAFDLIRSGVNAYSTDLSPSSSYAPPFLSSGEGQVVPLMPSSGPAAGTHGFGRFVTISGAAVNFFRSNGAFYTTTDDQPGSSVEVDPAYVDDQSNPQGVVIKPGAQIGAMLILNPVTVSPGFPPWSPHVQYVISGLDQFQISSASLGGYQSMGFPTNTALNNTVTSRAEFSGLWNCSPFFGLLANLRYANNAGTDATKTIGFSDPEKQYPFMVPISNSTGGLPPNRGVQLAPTDRTFDFSGGTLTIKIYAGADAGLVTPIQTILMNFPEVKGLRVPTTLPKHTLKSAFPPASIPGVNLFTTIGDIAPGASLGKPWHNMLIYYAPVTGAPGFLRTYPRLGSGMDPDGNVVDYWVRNITRGIEADASSASKGDYRMYAGLSDVPSSYFAKCPGYDVTGTLGQKYSNIQSLRDAGTDSGGGGGFGYDDGVPGGYYPHYPITSGGSDNKRSQVLLSPSHFKGVLIPRNLLASYGGADGAGSNTGDQQYRYPPAVPNGLNGAFLSNGNYGDWDNGTGMMEDGPYINKPDDGNSATVSTPANLQPATGNKATITGGYFSFGSNDYVTESGATFSPNRQISSAIMFGSLPTGIDPSGASPKPWQTLLFCPNPAANSSPGAVAGASHPGFGTPASGPPYTTPPDHLWLDLFTMPVVEPYAISEPFSTAGKINMNYQIAPFSYLRRDTGVRAVLKATRIMAIPQSASTVTSASQSYKDGIPCKYELRYNINPDENTGTLAGFEDRFNKSDIFRSASEICSIFLVPELIPNLGSTIPRLGSPAIYPPGSTPPNSYAATASWWNNFLLTGDNTRESPYNDIYGRLTTKSNTYTIHYKVQTLKKLPTTPAGQWVEGKDLVTGEIRGSSTVERYIDLNNPDLPDFATDTSASAEDYYKVRIIASTTFSP